MRSGKMRDTFQKALLEVQQDILRMASLTEEAIYNSIKALNNQDIELGYSVIQGDDKIDDLRNEIEDKCITLIATQQPLATDLRIVVTGIKITTSLERMADHAADISKIAMCMIGKKELDTIDKINRMAGLVQSMVKDGLDAYMYNDLDKAISVGKKDDDVDDLYHQVFKELIDYMKSDPNMIAQATYLLFVSRFLERIGDHSNNIAKNVIYLITGNRKVKKNKHIYC